MGQIKKNTTKQMIGILKVEFKDCFLKVETSLKEVGCFLVRGL